jgi:hypothetical protein
MKAHMQGELILPKLKLNLFHIFVVVVINYQKGEIENPSLVLVINDTKLLMPFCQVN